MIFGYARVSTRGQAREGNSLEVQEKILKDNGVEKIFVDSFTGIKLERPQLTALLKMLHEGDTLVCTKLDRIARSLSDGSTLINELIEKGIKVHILNIGIMDNTSSSKLIRNIFFSFAEFERELIIQRTHEGKEIAKQKPDYKEGHPKVYGKKQIEHALQLLENNSYRQVEEVTGISKSTLIRAKKKAIRIV